MLVSEWNALTDDQKIQLQAKSAAAGRREKIATAALQGLLSDYEPNSTYAVTAEVAVKYADALIAELDK